MDVKARALRQALGALPRRKAEAVVRACGLTREEERCILEGLGGADLTWVSTALCTSERTASRLRSSAYQKICSEIHF